jgi:hypothetical protein
MFAYNTPGDVANPRRRRPRPPERGPTTVELEGILRDHPRVWLVLWAVRESDPEEVIEGWLNDHAFKSNERWFGSVRLAVYSAPRAAGASPDRAADFRFGDGIALTGYSLRGSDGGTGAVAGEVLQLTLFWRALAPVGESYKVFTHLIDAKEHLWGQRDAEPGSGRRPTAQWSAGEEIVDQYGLPVLAGTPPGEYQVEIGLYRPSDGTRLPVRDGAGRALGDRLLLGPVRVAKASAPPAVAALPIERAKEAQFGPLRLLGYELYRLGTGPGAVDFKPGGVAHLGLYWQASEKPPDGLRVRVRVVDGGGRAVVERETVPADGAYPTGGWERGEIVLDQHKLALPAAGSYRLLLSVAGAAGEPVELDRIEVR